MVLVVAEWGGGSGGVEVWAEEEESGTEAAHLARVHIQVAWPTAMSPTTSDEASTSTSSRVHRTAVRCVYLHARSSVLLVMTLTLS